MIKAREADRMDWNEILRRTVEYLEAHLCDGEGLVTGAAREVHISPFYLQKCFEIVTGYTISEYVRSRR
ncbi:MAG: AraC family transcriptional regulator, partial [Ruminiclostridium sp.]|nr:AraC family transcriptional regulator [Ruminiclostridium sp.]